MRADKIPGSPRAYILDTYQDALNAINNPDSHEFVTFFRSKIYDPEIFQSYILYFMGLDSEGIFNRTSFDDRLLKLTQLLQVRLSSKLYAEILFNNYTIENSSECPDWLRDGSYMSLLLMMDLENFCKDKISTDLASLLKYYEGKDGFTERHEYLLWQQKQNEARMKVINEQIRDLEQRGTSLDQSAPISVIERFIFSTQKLCIEGEDILDERLSEAENIKNLTSGSRQYADMVNEVKVLKKRFLTFVENYEKFTGVKPKDFIKKFNDQYNDYPELKAIEGKVEGKVINPLFEGLIIGSSFVPPDEQTKPRRKKPLEHLDLEMPKTKAPRQLISVEKSLSLQEFLDDICFNQKYGYYSNISEDLGFTTIASGYKTQLGFAAALLAKALTHWISSGKPTKFMMLQLSGGNGELELSILSLAQIMAKNGSPLWQGFYDSLHFRTIDISLSLSERQKTLCEKYREKFEVVHGDATSKESWKRIEDLGCGAHLVISNELLDMTFPKLYGLSKEGKITEPYIATKITDFNEFRTAVWNKVGKDSPAGKLFLELSKNAIGADKKSPVPLYSEGENIEVFFDKNTYKDLMVFLHDNGLRNDSEINKYFKHIIVDVPLELSPGEDRELRSRLFQEAPLNVKKGAEGQKYLYTDSVAAKKIFDMRLPNQQAYHFDYFSRTLERDWGLLRHYGDAGGEMVLQESASGEVEFIRPDPHLVDTTHSVSQIKGLDPMQHEDFISSQNKVWVEEIREVTGIDTDYFRLFSVLHPEMKFIAVDEKKAERPGSTVAVRGLLDDFNETSNDHSR